MKTIGLIGGMSWESSAHYYRLINETVRNRCGPLHSAQSLMYSVNFHEVEQLQHSGQWEQAGALMAGAAQRLEKGGADCVVLCTNTMHKVADAIEAAVGIPLIHIADPTADAIKGAGLKKVGLLGTGFTMEQDFYRGRLERMHGLEVVVPAAADRAIVHRVIYDELCAGQVKPAARAEYKRIMQRLADDGAEGIILGCTEIMMLVGAADSPVPVFDTTTLHARAAAGFALQPE